MIAFVCTSCALLLRVLPDSVTSLGVQELESLVGPRSDLWPTGFTCPTCERPLRGLLESEVDPRAFQLFSVRDLSPKEAFSALQGLGLPEEQVFTLDAVETLFKEKGVRKVRGHAVSGAPTLVVDAIELSDGTTVFLGASPDGAVIYRVRPPHLHVTHVTSEGRSP